MSDSHPAAVHSVLLFETNSQLPDFMRNTTRHHRNSTRKNLFESAQPTKCIRRLDGFPDRARATIIGASPACDAIIMAASDHCIKTQSTWEDFSVEQAGATLISCRDETLYPLIFLTDLEPAPLDRTAQLNMCLARMPYDPKASLTDQWTLTANPGVLAHDTLLALVSKYGPTSAQIFSRYLTQIDITPFNGTTSQIHMREDMAIFEFELTRSECDAVARLLL